MPCALRPDPALDGNAADGDRAAQAGHLGAMLAENLHRQGLSAVEEARGVQAMLDLAGCAPRRPPSGHTQDPHRVAVGGEQRGRQAGDEGHQHG